MGEAVGGLSSPSRAAGWSFLASAVVAVGLVALGVVMSNPRPIAVAAIPTVVAGSAGMVAVIRSRPRPASAGSVAVTVVGAVADLVGTVVAVTGLGVLVFVFSFGDPAMPDERATAKPERVCNAITQAENTSVADGATIEEVQASLARRLTLRDRYMTDSGSEITVYEWQQTWENGCQQYVSYEFLDGGLTFRRWSEAS